jgi:hypothetical protein
MLEGFLRANPEDLGEGTSLNLDAYRDEFSPYADLEDVRIQATDSDVWVDPGYGHCYGSWISQGGGIYGRLRSMPPEPLDVFADMGFLGLPFARIPRIKAHDYQRMTEVIARIQDGLPKNTRLLLRGQDQEYTLGRPPKTLNALYGEPDTIEPSLQPSATRAGLDMNQAMPAWCGLLQWLLDMLPPLPPEESKTTRFDQWFNDYSFSRFAMAIAQHYGLPSSGLDTTSSLDVALFFALNVFVPDKNREGWARYCKKTDWRNPSVVYAFVAPSPGHVIQFSGVVPPDLPTTRPKRQEAAFLHHGWGFALNDCARFLSAAMYIDQDFQPPELPSSTYLFPSEDEDPFAAGLDACKSVGLLVPTLKPLLSHLYWIA